MGTFSRLRISTETRSLFGASEAGPRVSWDSHDESFAFEPNTDVVLFNALGNPPVHQLPAAPRQFKEHCEFGGRLEGEAAIPKRRTR